jgi:hypothetical protein
MKRMFALLLCLGFVHSASAAILFYKQSMTVTITGNGRVMKHAFGGFTLIDSATGDVMFISADVASKRFKVEQPDHKLTSVQASATGYRTILQILSGAGEGINARGNNVWLTVGASQPVSSPSSLLVGGCDAYVPSGLSSAYAFEYTGTMVYDKANTVAATINGLTLAGAADKVRLILGNQGYSED